MRNHNIDIIKIIAMAMVVYYHVCFYKQDFGYEPGSDVYLPNMARMVMSLCCAGVPLFFMCSGYCNAGKSWKGWWAVLKKVGTIAILAVFWNWLTPFPYWFLITLSGLYLITPILRYMEDKFPYLLWLGTIGIFVATMGMNLAYLITRAVGADFIPGYHQQGLMTTYAVVYYVLGAQMKKHLLPTWLSLVSIVAGYGLLMWEVVVHTTLDSTVFDGVNASFPTVGALLFSAGLFALLMRVPLNKTYIQKTAAFIASGCLMVYIFHLFVSKLLHQWINIPPQIGICAGMVLTLVVMVISFLMGWILSRIPVLRRLTKV